MELQGNQQQEMDNQQKINQRQKKNDRVASNTTLNAEQSSLQLKLTPKSRGANLIMQLKQRQEGVKQLSIILPIIYLITVL